MLKQDDAWIADYKKALNMLTSANKNSNEVSEAVEPRRFLSPEKSKAIKEAASMNGNVEDLPSPNKQRGLLAAPKQCDELETPITDLKSCKDTCESGHYTNEQGKKTVLYVIWLPLHVFGADNRCVCLIPDIGWSGLREVCPQYPPHYMATSAPAVAN